MAQCGGQRGVTSNRGSTVVRARWVLLGALPLSVAAQSTPTRISNIRCDVATSIAAPRLSWRGDVVQWAEWPVLLGKAGVRNRVMVVRAPLSRLRFVLDIARRDGEMLPWTLDEAPADVHIAVNAGQFTDEAPWGWVVHKQKELQPPGTGALAGAFVVDSAGRASLLSASEIAAWRTPVRAIEAFQSYPMLLNAASNPPKAMCDPRGGVDLDHRDSRLAVGITRTGELILALSRFEMPGGVATRVPIGPTTPEMAEIMRRLGADRALMLDGGLSAQMLVRAPADSARWPGLRAVPLALVARVTPR